MSHKPIQGLSDLPGQLRLPGTKRLKFADQPMRSDKIQKPCDHGLFSDDTDQIDLIEMLMEPYE